MPCVRSHARHCLLGRIMHLAYPRAVAMRLYAASRGSPSKVPTSNARHWPGWGVALAASSPLFRRLIPNQAETAALLSKPGPHFPALGGLAPEMVAKAPHVHHSIRHGTPHDSLQSTPTVFGVLSQPSQTTGIGSIFGWARGWLQVLLSSLAMERK